jgi:hypothetical protein
MAGSINTPPPLNIINLFGNWLNGISKKKKPQIRVGVCAVLWAIYGSTYLTKKSFPSFCK